MSKPAEQASQIPPFPIRWSIVHPPTRARCVLIRQTWIAAREDGAAVLGAARDEVVCLPLDPTEGWQPTVHLEEGRHDASEEDLGRTYQSHFGR